VREIEVTRDEAYAAPPWRSQSAAELGEVAAYFRSLRPAELEVVDDQEEARWLGRVRHEKRGGATRDNNNPVSDDTRLREKALLDEEHQPNVAV
jgi:hypothetical protein